MVLGFIIIALLLFALVDCLDLQNPVTTVYAGKTNGYSYINSCDYNKKPTVITHSCSCGNVFNDTSVNIALNSINSTFEEEYNAYKCVGKSRYSTFINKAVQPMEVVFGFGTTIASEMTLNYAHYYCYWFYYSLLLVLLLITSTFGGVIATFWLVNITLCQIGITVLL